MLMTCSLLNSFNPNDDDDDVDFEADDGDGGEDRNYSKSLKILFPE